MTCPSAEWTRALRQHLFASVKVSSDPPVHSRRGYAAWAATPVCLLSLRDVVIAGFFMSSVATSVWMGATFLEHLLFLWLAPGRGGAMSNTVLFHLLPLQGCFWVCSTPSTHNPLRKTAVSAGWLRGDDQPYEVEMAQRSTYKGHCLHHQVYRALIRGSSFTKFKIGISHLFSWEPSELSERCGFTICMSCSCLQLYTMCFPLWSGRTVCLKTMFKSICFLKLTNTPRYDFPLGIKPATQAALIPSFPISVLFSFFPLSTHLSFLCFF